MLANFFSYIDMPCGIYGAMYLTLVNDDNAFLVDGRFAKFFYLRDRWEMTMAEKRYVEGTGSRP
jgi:hypothetical protein